ncbi:MAG: hypothetical protein QXI48_05460 [Candidatus Bathyarchaeia archaeon]
MFLQENLFALFLVCFPKIKMLIERKTPVYCRFVASIRPLIKADVEAVTVAKPNRKP